MDPASAIGIIGSLVGVANVAGSIINTLSNLRTKYRNADLAVAALIGQLCTIKAALTQLGSCHDQQLQNLESELRLAVDACSLLVTSLDDKVTKLETKTAGQLSSKGKTSFLLAEKDLEHYLTLLDRQVNALSLLLVASQW